MAQRSPEEIKSAVKQMEHIANEAIRAKDMASAGSATAIRGALLWTLGDDSVGGFGNMLARVAAIDRAENN